MSARRALLAIVLILLGLIWAVVTSDSCAIRLHDKCVALERADTPELRVKGLSGRESLGTHEGMLFVFDEVDKQCMWMKDMKFAIDMLWLSEDKRISKIEENVSPDTYPELFCSDNTKYVIELPAGTARQAGLEQGRQLRF